MDLNENNEVIDVINENDNKEKNNKIIFITIISIFVILIVSFMAFALNGIFNSKSIKFLGLLTKDQKLIEIIDNRTDYFSDDGEVSYNVALKKKFLSTIDSTFILLGNDIVLNGNVIKEEDNLDAKASLKLGTFELQSLELVKEDDVYALSVPNLFTDFVAINDENALEIAKKLGFIESSGDSKIDLEVLKSINKYGKILLKSIEENITLKNNIEIIIDGNILKTKEYTLALTESSLNKLVMEVLDVLKNDDETINLILKYAGEEFEFLTNEDLKTEIVNLYNQLLEENANLERDEIIFEVNLNVFNNKTVKTVISLNETSKIILETNVNGENDYILVSLIANDTALDFEYNGSIKEDNYKGEINLKTEETAITAVELNIEKVKDSEAKVRKINELKVLLLNEATDTEIENLRKEIEKNLGLSEDEAMEYTLYDEGEFILENPDKRISVLEDSIEAYNNLQIGMTRDDIIKIMGEPDASFEANERENMGWYFDENNSIYYISVELSENKAYKIYNDIVSDMKDNIQVSVELGTEIEDLTTIVGGLKYGMTKSEVINILGDKYLEISKDEEGYKTYKWYDKRENIIVIEFDSEEKVSYVDEVMMDI